MKTLVLDTFSNKGAGLQPATLNKKKASQRRCFPSDLATPRLCNSISWMLLVMVLPWFVSGKTKPDLSTEVYYFPTVLIVICIPTIILTFIWIKFLFILWCFFVPIIRVECFFFRSLFDSTQMSVLVIEPLSALFILITCLELSTKL